MDGIANWDRDGIGKNGKSSYLCIHKTERTGSEGRPVGLTEADSATIAQVAELVDALVSGTSDSNVVQVRFLSWAPRAVSDRNAQVAELVDALL